MEVDGPSLPPPPQKKEAMMLSEKIFKYICIFLVAVLFYCIQGFLNFRLYCQQRGYHVFQSDSLIWCLVGFCSIFVAKYVYYAFMRKRIEKIVNPRYIGSERIWKRDMILKLSYDSCFYAFATITSYAIFSQEYWFPAMAGGSGACEKIYNDYPNWPSSKRKQIQVFFMMQLGVHVFSVFEMVVIKRKTERKFFEYLLHHFVAATLILCSMMCNQVTAGLMVLIVHDASDIFVSFGRAYQETNFSKHPIIAITLFGLLISTWVYMRLIVFPFCLLSNVYINSPGPADEWFIIRFEYLYLLSMAFVLVGMHLYWTFYIFKSLINSIVNKRVLNEHEKIKQKKDEVIDTVE